MAGENLLKKAADWDSLAAGIEAVDGAIRLATGSGGWDGNSLDGTVTPPAPWAITGSMSVVESRLIYVNDLAGAGDFAALNNPNWNENFTTGLTLHFRALAKFSSGLDGVAIHIDDGVSNWTINFNASGIIIKGAGTTTISTKNQIAWGEIFGFINNDLLTLWIFNDFTQTWEVLVTNNAPAGTAANRIIFGSITGPGVQGVSYWDLVRWKSSQDVTPFLTTSPVSTMGVVALPVGFIVNGLGDFRTSIAGSGTLKASYNINNAGWSGLFDDIEALNVFLLANPIEITDGTNSVDLRMTHGSDGLEQVQFWPGEGPNLTGGGAADDTLMGGTLGSF